MLIIINHNNNNNKVMKIKKKMMMMMKKKKKKKKLINNNKNMNLMIIMMFRIMVQMNYRWQKNKMKILMIKKINLIINILIWLVAIDKNKMKKVKIV